jgi:hypothetical protein
MNVAEIMDFGREGKIEKSWPVIIGKLWQEVAVASGAEIDA